MTMKRLSDSFGAELRAAGLGDLPISWGSDGAFTVGDDVTTQQREAVQAVIDAHNPDAGDLAQARAAAIVAIDACAARTRLKFITSGAGQTSVYILKEQQARAYAAANFAGAAPLFVQAEADASGHSAQQAAEVIIAKADEWITAAAEIERARRAGKIEVDSADTLEEIETARTNAATALQAIEP